MACGIVKWFDSKKGYGFIQQENGSDVFVHFSDIQVDGYKALNDGDSVEFELSKGDIGPRAANVKVLSTK